MNRMDAEFLVSECAGRILQEVRGKFPVHDELKIANYLSKNTDLTAHERAVLLEQLMQENRPKSKILHMSGCFFERSALEQATAFSISLFHRFISRIFRLRSENVKILDGCAGLGFDSHVFGMKKAPEIRVFLDDSTKEHFKTDKNVVNETALNADVTAVEKDEAISILLKKNLEKYNNINCYNADVLDFLRDAGDLNEFQFMFFDPSRRTPEIKRIENIEDFAPSPIEIVSILKEKNYQGSVGFKLAPKTPVHALNQDFENANIFIVSLKNEIKETFILLTPRMQGQKLAVVVKESGDSADIYIQNGELNHISDLPVTTPEIGNYLIHPAPALRSLNLIPQDICTQNDQISCINDETPMILCEKPLTSEIAQTYEIIGIAQPNFQELKKELHRLNCYAFSTKNYHVKRDNFAIDKLASKKGQPAYLFFVRTVNGVRCLITHRLTQEKIVEE